jgi:hypothetical protein
MKKYGTTPEKTREIWRSINIRKVLKKHIACQRCGLCCKAGVCGVGKEDKNGRCIFLVKLEDKYSCKLYAQGKVEGGRIGIGNGCVVRALPREFFSFYSDNYGPLP